MHAQKGAQLRSTAWVLAGICRCLHHEMNSHSTSEAGGRSVDLGLLFAPMRYFARGCCLLVDRDTQFR